MEEYRIPLLVLMENAGRAVAETALRMLHTPAALAVQPGKAGRPLKALILTGPGNNGGDGVVAARHLHNQMIDVTILLLSRPDKAESLLAQQLAITDAMRIRTVSLTSGHAEMRDWIVDSAPHDLVIDALFGTGLSRPLEGLAAEAVRAANGAHRPILAIDIPSGLDGDTGLPVAGNSAEHTIQATHTVSFNGSKPGYREKHSHKFTGKVTVADIGAPRELLEQLASR